MAYLDTFNMVVGNTIMECQRIEHDIKLIYAGMLKGDFNENIKLVKDLALGPVLIELEQLDNSDKKPYLTADDYKLLKQIKNVRNWLVHKVYMDFMYEKQAEWEDSLNKSYAKLLDFNSRIKGLSNQVEQIRIDVLKKFGRI